MKKIAVSVLLLCGVLFYAAAAKGSVLEEIRTGVEQAMQDANVSAWDELLNELPQETKRFWEQKDANTLVRDYATGETPYLGDTVFSGLLEQLKSILPDFSGALIRLLIVSLISGFVKAMGEAGVSGLQDVAGFVCHAAAVIIAVATFMTLVETAKDTMDRTSRFIALCFPVLLTMLTALGGISAAGIFQPAMAMLTGGISLVLQRIVLPLILAGSVLAVLNNMTGRTQLKHLLGLCKSAVKWILGLVFTLYFGVTSLQGMTAAAVDNITVRTAKYAMDKMIPIVGGAVSGMVDTVLGCSLLVKNAAGAAAILIAFGIVCRPLLEIAAGIFAFRIAAAVSEPIADARLPQMMTALSEMLTYLFAVTLVLALMFVLTVGLVMSAGTGAVAG
ncbi:MAG: stage III sporulation protein AE [Eubacteriales bacterium]|nr:stage III sporulation protein AE [Eubacteriales bacterium]